MRTAKSGTVTGAQGNVIFCEFGAASTSVDEAGIDLGTDLAAIRSAIAEIHVVSRDILSASLAVTQCERESSRALLDAVGRLDNVAFRAGLVADSAGQDESGQLERAAGDARRLTAAGVAAANWLRTTVTEQKCRMAASARILREIVEQVGELETLTRLCVESPSATVPEAEVTN